jgi:ABC-2 type transport system permease protein
MKLIRKSLYFFKLSLRNFFAEAEQTFIWILVGGASSFTSIYIWVVIAEEEAQIGNVKLSDLVNYYLFYFLTWYIIGGTFKFMMEETIRTGNLSNSLLKPTFAFLREIMTEQAWKVFGLLSGIFVFVGMSMYFKDSINFSIDPIRLLHALLAIILGAIVFGSTEFIIGICAFWTNSTEGIARLYETIREVLGGALVPFMLLPQGIKNIASLLPFRYSFSFPAEIFLNQLSNTEILQGYLIQVFWVIILLLVCKIFYKFGIKKYEAFGN